VLFKNGRQAKESVNAMPTPHPKVAIYPGSFDPVTNGHIDIVKRGRKLFDKIVVAILLNVNKEALFTVDERMEMLQESMKDIPGIVFDTFDGLLVDYANRCGAQAILRGMRAVSDFDYEFQMALMNRKLNRDVQTVFLMTSLRWIFTSSSIIKEAARFGGDISDMVPPLVNRKIKDKYGADGS
jgi:pantetheine-phosphate adenylyltransferase